MDLLFGFCIVSIIVIGIFGCAANGASGNVGNSIVFLFLTFCVGMPLISVGYDYSDANTAKQVYCTKYYNNNVNKYKVCMNKDLDKVITNGLK